MPRAELLSGRGVMEYHLPSCVGQKKSISHLTDEGGLQATNKHQLKTNLAPPPRWSLPARRRGRSSSIAGGCFLQTPYRLDGGDAYFCDAVDACDCRCRARYPVPDRRPLFYRDAGVASDDVVVG